MVKALACLVATLGVWSAARSEQPEPQSGPAPTAAVPEATAQAAVAPAAAAPDAPAPAAAQSLEATAPPAPAVVISEELDAVTVSARMPTLAEMATQRVSEAEELLRGVELNYTFIKRFRRETLRGRPVTFAAWSELRHSWHVVEIELPFPPPRWRPGKRLAFRVITPGFTAVHVRGIGTERLMFDIYRGDEKLRVYGRKYPMIELPAVKKLGVRGAVANAEVTHYLPMLDDTAPLFVTQGQALLRSTAKTALRELRESQVGSFAYPGRLLGDTVLPETLMSLAVIEQTDDGEFRRAPVDALNKTVGHYGLMQQQAFTYSVSTAKAMGPMQFTDRRGRGTYSMVVRRCADADLAPDFSTGARDLLNAMKAAACLLDMDMAGMPSEVQAEYALNPAPLSIFGIAAYNGGGRNASKLMRTMRRLKVPVSALRVPELADFETLDTRCPCLWMDRGAGTTALRLPAYNRENIGYVDKYLRFMSMMRAPAAP